MGRAKDTSDVDWGKYFYYDETSPNCLRWAVDRYRGKDLSIKFINKGEVPGWLDETQGRYRVSAEGNMAMAHQIVWFLHNGAVPDVGFQIDHFDRNPLNNKIGNLRLIPSDMNRRNAKLSSANKSGVCGVYCFELVSGGGNHLISRYWQANWRENGKLRRKNFSINKLGNEEAFRLACEHREKMIEALNAQGAGYTEDHGKRIMEQHAA